MNTILSSGNAHASCFRSISIRKGSNAAASASRPWCGDGSMVIARRSWQQSQWTTANSRRRYRPIGLTSFSNAASPISTTRRFKGGSNAFDNHNSSNNFLARRIGAAVFAAIVSGVFFDRLGTIDSCENVDDDGRFGGIKQPMVARMMKRRGTSLQIRFGDSVLLDHDEPRSSRTVAGANDEDVVLLLPEDKESISPFLYYLMQQVKLVRVEKDDQFVYNKPYGVPVGLPGLGCVHCSSSTLKKTRRQIFPMDRRTFPKLVRKDLYSHIRRCERCPVEVKLELRRLKKLEAGTKISREERQFFKRLWFRMGHKEFV